MTTCFLPKFRGIEKLTVVGGGATVGALIVANEIWGFLKNITRDLYGCYKIGAVRIANTILGVPYYSSSIAGPKILF